MGWLQAQFGEVDSRASSEQGQIEGKVAEHSPAAWADAGATWWLETQWDAVGREGPALATFDRLREGPPRP